MSRIQEIHIANDSSVNFAEQYLIRPESSDYWNSLKRYLCASFILNRIAYTVFNKHVSILLIYTQNNVTCSQYILITALLDLDTSFQLLISDKLRFAFFDFQCGFRWCFFIQ